MGSNNSDLQIMERQIRQLQAQLNSSRELPGDMMSRILAAERSRQMGRTRRACSPPRDQLDAVVASGVLSGTAANPTTEILLPP